MQDKHEYSAFCFELCLVLGLKTCVITNNWKDDIHPPFTDRTFLSLDYFDLILESCVLGIRKPDKRIYQIALDRMGVSAEEVEGTVCVCLCICVYFVSGREVID